MSRLRWKERWVTVLRFEFLSRTELLLFFCSLLFAGIYWRFGVLISDTFTVANTLLAVSEGHLFLDTLQYGGDVSPGMSYSEGKLYGRNYGMAFLATPILWMIEFASGILDLRIMLVGLWCTMFMWAIALIGERLGLKHYLIMGGVIAAIFLFIVNMMYATEIVNKKFPIIALQILSLSCFSITTVLIQRIVRRLHGEFLGTLAGFAAIVAIPLSYWATIPKRHAVVAMFLILGLYLFGRSFDATGVRGPWWYRASAYGSVGFTAWVHPGEALFALAGLGLVDITVRQDAFQFKELILVGLVLIAALSPFFVTNTVASGDPLSPPILNEKFDGTQNVTVGPDRIVNNSTGRKITTSVGASGNRIDIKNSSPVLTGSEQPQLEGIGRLVRQTRRAIEALGSPYILFWAYIESGYVTSVVDSDLNQELNLAIFESSPLLTITLPAILSVLIRYKKNENKIIDTDTHIIAVNSLSVVWILAFTFLYLPDLPESAQFTVRYLIPITPLFIILLSASDLVQQVTQHWRLMCWSVAGGTLIGGQLALGWMILTAPGIGEAIQFHGLINHLIGAGLVLWGVGEVLTSRDMTRLGAFLFGLAVSGTIVFVVLSGVGYLNYSTDLMLPVMSEITSQLDKRL
jgi:hypothetical protein